jgi:DNA-binding NarL/FixJ family response regulator
MRKLNVLLVDDNPQFLKAARNLIGALPCVVGIECANSGVEALAQMGLLNPDLVLTDIMMPEMSGFELIRKLCARDPPPRIVAVSLHEAPEYRAAALRSGAEGLISKREFGAVAPNLIASMACTGNA